MKEKTMEKIVEDLKNIFTFRDTTQEGDIVLIVADQLLYAIVIDITRDDNKKDEWWHVTMQLLVVPPQKLVWTLRTEQMTGMEIFTMGGEERFVKAIDFMGPKPKDKGKSKAKGKKGLRLVK